MLIGDINIATSHHARENLGVIDSISDHQNNDVVPETHSSNREICDDEEESNIVLVSRTNSICHSDSLYEEEIRRMNEVADELTEQKLYSNNCNRNKMSGDEEAIDSGFQQESLRGSV